MIGTRTPYAWRKAAVATALLTDNANPSCQDIVDAGLWPFQPDMGMNLLQLPGDSWHSAILTETELANVGSEFWLIDFKRNILDLYYDEYYFDSYNFADATSSLDIKLPDDLVENAGFWKNSETKAPYVMGAKKGQFHFTRASWACPDGKLLLPGISSDDLYLKVINVWDAPADRGMEFYDYPVVVDNKTDQTSDDSDHQQSAVSDVADSTAKRASGDWDDWCCVFRRTIVDNPPTHQYETTVYCYCPDTGDYVPCKVYWRWPDGGQQYNYHVEGIMECDMIEAIYGYPYPKGMVVVACGETLKMYAYAIGDTPGVGSFICLACPAMPQYDLGSMTSKERAALEERCAKLSEVLDGIAAPHRVLLGEVECTCGPMGGGSANS
jgi:hypothetical protein